MRGASIGVLLVSIGRRGAGENRGERRPAWCGMAIAACLGIADDVRHLGDCLCGSGKAEQHCKQCEKQRAARGREGAHWGERKVAKCDCLARAACPPLGICDFGQVSRLCLAHFVGLAGWAIRAGRRSNGSRAPMRRRYVGGIVSSASMLPGWLFWKTWLTSWRSPGPQGDCCGAESDDIVPTTGSAAGTCPGCTASRRQRPGRGARGAAAAHCACRGTMAAICGRGRRIGAECVC